VKITVDGRETAAQPGQTVAAVVPRLVFCGIGVCFDCVVTVNGVSEVRACQRVLADGDDVRTTA
jgi:hypothetical protein